MTTSAEGSIAGWYDDGSGNERYWDGQKWTGHIRPKQAVPAENFTYAASAPSNPPLSRSPVGVKSHPQKSHALAWVALAVAVVGFIFACVKGALIVGWILLPVAFILSIVSFFLKGRKWPAVTALILSVIGTIVGVVVFLTVVASSIEDATDGTQVTTSEPTGGSDADRAQGGDAADGSAKSSDGGQGKPAGDAGTRGNPVHVGTTVHGANWDVTVNSVDLDGTKTVLKANMFNDKPKHGFKYAIVNLTITYRGDDSGDTFEVGTAYVTGSGEVLESSDTMAVPPKPALGSKELYNGGTAKGNTVIAVPIHDKHGLVRITPGLLSDDVFVALK